MLEPILCGPLARAPLLPKLRGHFAEFLGNASSAGLRILSSSTCVGFRYGRAQIHSGFSWRLACALRYFSFAPLHGFGFWLMDLPLSRLLRLRRASLSRLALAFRVPTRSVCARYRNLHLFPIDYAFRPRLRPRLTQGRSALPWKPWTFGRRDSHPALATHSGILSS